MPIDIGKLVKKEEELKQIVSIENPFISILEENQGELSSIFSQIDELTKRRDDLGIIISEIIAKSNAFKEARSRDITELDEISSILRYYNNVINDHVGNINSDENDLVSINFTKGDPNHTPGGMYVKVDNIPSYVDDYDYHNRVMQFDLRTQEHLYTYHSLLEAAKFMSTKYNDKSIKYIAKCIDDVCMGMHTDNVYFGIAQKDFSYIWRYRPSE